MMAPASDSTNAAASLLGSYRVVHFSIGCTTPGLTFRKSPRAVSCAPAGNNTRNSIASKQMTGRRFHRCQLRQANVHNILSHTRGSPRIEVRDR